MKRVWNTVFLALLALVLVGGGLGTLILERLSPCTALFYENRAPDPAPAWTLSGLWSGGDFTALDGYLADRFPGREKLIAADTALDLAAGRPVIRGVAQGDGVIFPFHGYARWDLSYIAAMSADMGDRLAAINDQVEGYGGTLIYVGLPQQYSYLRGEYPAYMDNREWVSAETRTQFSKALAERGVDFLDMEGIYDAQGRPREYYAASDHHYSYLGMLRAYEALMEEINAKTGRELKIYTEEDLDLEILDNPFLGSQNRMMYGLWPGEEKLTLGHLKEPIPFTRTDNGIPVESELYQRPATSTERVTYSVYMGGDVGETVIQTGREDLPKLLIWGDSFSNPMETILWASFGETRSLDFRYYWGGKTLSEYIAEYQPDVVVCIRDDTSYLSFEGNGNLS